MDTNEQNPKVAKKLAKAAAKAAKKQSAAPNSGPGRAGAARTYVAGDSPAERAAAAAERQVALQRWRVVLAVVTAIIALGSLLVVWWARN
jgi:cobalamin biosynthesis Mg chelatase CobN